jgi:hypothetical protein
VRPRASLNALENRKNLLQMPGFEPRYVGHPVTVLTELPHLRRDTKYTLDTILASSRIPF